MAIKVNNNKQFSAVKKFTDREEPRKVFWDTYNEYKACMNDNPDIKVIAYYGIGGIGKTRLLNQIKDELTERIGKSSRFVILDFDKYTGFDGLHHIQAVLRNEYGFRFPRYDMGIFQRFKLEQEGKKIDVDKINWNKIKPCMGESADDFFDLTAALFELPGLDYAPKVARFSYKLLNHVMDNLQDNEFKEQIEAKKTVAEVNEFLPELLGKDIETNMKSAKEPLVIFLDTYEKLVDELALTGYSYTKDEWLKGFKGLILNTPKTIWVIAGRERLKWEEQNSDWKGSLEQHMIGNISETDAEDYFTAEGIPAKLQPGLYQKTKGVPLLLDLSVDTYIRIKQRGEEPSIDQFGNNEQTIVERYIRYMSTFQQEIMYKMAFLRKWPKSDNSVFRYGGSTFDLSQFHVLENSSIVQCVEGVCSLHEVVSDVLREEGIVGTSKEICHEYLSDLMGYFRENIPNINDDTSKATYLLTTSVCIAVECYGQEELDAFLHDVIWPKMRYLIDKKDKAVVGICQNIHKELSRKFGEDYVETITAMFGIGAGFRNRGEYKNAFDVFTKVLDLRRRKLGEDDPDTISAMSNLSISYGDMGDYQKALELEIKVLDLRRNKLRQNHPDTINAMNNLAASYRDMGDFQKALELETEVLACYKQELGEEKRDTIIAMSNLAVSYRGIGDYKKALELKTKVYDLSRRFLGKDSLDTINAMNNLAVSYGDMGDYQKALELFAKALDWYSNFFDEKHPDTIIAMSNLAISYYNLGNHQKALELETKVLELSRSTFWEKHPVTINAMNILNENYRDVDDYPKTLEFWGKNILTQ